MSGADDPSSPPKEVVLTRPREDPVPPRLVRQTPCTTQGGKASSFFSAQPAVVHFAGFQVGKTQSACLRLVNIASIGQRLHVVGPQSSQFHMRWQKKGRVAPGMAEVLWVDFTPDEWRYYYDAVKVECKDETLLVPIHAYPVLEYEDIASRLDFGACFVREAVVASLDVRCDVPVAFEYRIRVSKPDAQFELLTPLEGVIPGESTVRIRVKYTPTKLGTATMRLELDVSQLDSAPRIVDVVGNAVSRTKKRTQEARPLAAAAAAVAAAPAALSNNDEQNAPREAEEPEQQERLDVGPEKRADRRLEDVVAAMEALLAEESYVAESRRRLREVSVAELSNVDAEEAERKRAAIDAELVSRAVPAKQYVPYSRREEKPAVVETLYEGMEIPGDLDEVRWAPVAFPGVSPPPAPRSPIAIGEIQLDEEEDDQVFELEDADPLLLALNYGPFEPPRVFVPVDIDRDPRPPALDESAVRAPRETSTSDWTKTRTLFEPDKAPEEGAEEDEVLAVAAKLASNPSSIHLSDTSLLSPPAVDGWALLAPRPDDVPYQRPPLEDEASLSWPLRVRKLERPPSLAARVAANRSALTMSAYANFPEPSVAFRPKRERRASALGCLSEQYHLRGWAVEAAVPLPLAGPDADDVLSESESDDDDYAHDEALPDPDACRDQLGLNNLDDDHHHHHPESPLRSPTAFAKCVNDQPGDSKVAVISDIPRDRNRLELYRAQAAKRAEAASRLGRRLDRVARLLRSPDLRAQFAPRLPLDDAPGDGHDDDDAFNDSTTT